MRRGFTLMEVNLAMFIMAVGTLGLVSLYTFGYRENQQSVEDVQAAAIAEMNMNAMAAALSSTNMTWESWKSLGQLPRDGWGKYAGDGTNSGISDNAGTGSLNPLSDPSSEARSVFDAVMSAAGGANGQFSDQGLCVGIVLTPDNATNPRMYTIAVRCGKRAATLVYQPLYYTAVYFQGLPKEAQAQ